MLRMSFSAFFILLVSFVPAIIADNIPSVSINLSRNTWKVETLRFNRYRRKENRSVDLIDVKFDLYHPKFETCTRVEGPELGFYRGGNNDPWWQTAELQDPEFCVNWQNSQNRVSCENGTNTLWRPCSGRRSISSSCGDDTGAFVFLPESGCTNITQHDEESERPWVKWRVLGIDEPKDIGRAGWTVDPSKPFHSLTIEIVSGQRFFPNGTSPLTDQIVLYNSKFTILRNMTRCFVDSSTAASLGYSCELEVSQLDPWLYRGTCVAGMNWIAEFILPGSTPKCGFRVPFEYRLESLKNFKAAYWS